MFQLLPRARCMSLLELSSGAYQAKQIHAQMITNALLRDARNIAKLIEKYCANSKQPSQASASTARLLFLHSAEESKDSFLCNAMLKHALRSTREGNQLHARSLKHGQVSQLSLPTTFVHFYALCNDLAAARRLFDEMPERNSATWNAMMTGYCFNGLGKDAVALFKEMVRGKGSRPTERTTMLLLCSCSQLGDLALGAAAHSRVLKTISDPLHCLFIGTGLVDMYSKCGSLESASALFRAMTRRNVISWSTMAAALAVHGHGEEVVELLKLMEKEGIAPNAITFTSLLSACCHAGLVEEGLQLFVEMPSRFNVAPGMQHYGCVVDLLGRAGMVEEAHEFVKNMPVQPDAVVWRALLGACKMHGKAELGSEIGKILIGLERRLQLESLPLTACEDFIALSNVYALADRWEEVCSVRTVMKKKGIQNKPGFSSVQNVQSRLEMQTEKASNLRFVTFF